MISILEYIKKTKPSKYNIGLPELDVNDTYDDILKKLKNNGIKILNTNNISFEGTVLQKLCKYVNTNNEPVAGHRCGISNKNQTLYICFTSGDNIIIFVFSFNDNYISCIQQDIIFDKYTCFPTVSVCGKPNLGTYIDEYNKLVSNL